MADDIVLNIVLNGLDDIIAQLQQAGQAGSTAFDALAEAAAKISGHADEASASIGKTAETTHAAEINVAALGEKGTRAFSGLASASEKFVGSVNSLSATGAIAAFEELGRTVEGVAGSFGRAGEAAAIFLGGITALGAGVAGAVYAFKELATSSAEDVVGLENVATQAGTTIENIVGLRSAFAAAGVSSEGFAYSFKNLALRIQSDWPEIVRSVRDSADTLETDQIKIREATVGIATAQDQAAASFIKTREAVLGVSDAQRKVESSDDAIKSAQLNLVDAQDKIRTSYLARQQAALSVEQAEYNLRVAQGGGRDKDVEDALKLEAAELAVKKAKEQRREAAKGIERDTIAERTAQQGLQNAYAQQEKDTLALQKAKLDLVAAEREQAQAGDKQRTAALEASAAQKKADDDRLKDLPAIAEAIQHVTSGAGKLQGDVDLGRVASGDLLKAIELNAGKAKGAVDGLGKSIKKPEGFETLLQISEAYQKLGKELDADAKSAITRLALGRQATQELTTAVSQGPKELTKYAKAHEDVGKAIAASAARSKALIASQHELADTLENTKDLIGGTFNEDFTKGFDSLNQALTGNRENLVEFTKNLTNVHQFIQDLFKVLSGQPAEGTWMKTLIADAKEFYKTLVEIKDIVDSVAGFLNKIGLGKPSEEALAKAAEAKKVAETKGETPPPPPLGAGTGFVLTDIIAGRLGEIIRDQISRATTAPTTPSGEVKALAGTIPPPRDFSIREQPQGPDERRTVTGVQPVPVTIVPSTPTPITPPHARPLFSVPGAVPPPSVGTEGADGIVPLIQGANDVGAAFAKAAGAVDTFLTALNPIGAAQAAEPSQAPPPVNTSTTSPAPTIIKGGAAAPEPSVETVISTLRDTIAVPLDKLLSTVSLSAVSAGRPREGTGRPVDDKLLKDASVELTTAATKQSTAANTFWDAVNKFVSAVTGGTGKGGGENTTTTTPTSEATKGISTGNADTDTKQKAANDQAQEELFPGGVGKAKVAVRGVQDHTQDDLVDKIDPKTGQPYVGPFLPDFNNIDSTTDFPYASGHDFYANAPPRVLGNSGVAGKVDFDSDKQATQKSFIKDQPPPLVEPPSELTDNAEAGIPGAQAKVDAWYRQHPDVAREANRQNKIYTTDILPGQEDLLDNAPAYGPGGRETPSSGAGGGTIGQLAQAAQAFGNAAQTFAQAVSQGTGKPVSGADTPTPTPLTSGPGASGALPATSAALPQPSIAPTLSATSGLPTDASSGAPASQFEGAAQTMNNAAQTFSSAVSAEQTKQPAGAGDTQQQSGQANEGDAKSAGAAGSLSAAVEGLTNAGTTLSDAAQAMSQAASAVSDAASRLSTPGHAGGGLIHGAGTTTSDSIPARLSHGEYVVQARAVKHYGVDAMHRINQMHTPAMAIGGYIDALTAPSFKAGGAVKHDLLKTIETINQQHVQATTFGQLPGVTKAPGVQLKAGGLLEWLENPRSIPSFKAGGLVEWLARPVSAPGFKAGGAMQHDLLKTMDVINQQHERATAFGQLAGVPKAPGVQLAEGGLVEGFAAGGAVHHSQPFFAVPALSIPGHKAGGLVEWLSAIPAFKAGGLVEGNMIGGGFETMPGFAAGGRVDHVSQQHLTKTSAGASGPYASAGGSGGQRALTLVIEGKQFPGLSGPANVVGDMERHATGSRLSRISRNNPSWRK